MIQFTPGDLTSLTATIRVPAVTRARGADSMEVFWVPLSHPPMGLTTTPVERDSMDLHGHVS